MATAGREAPSPQAPLILTVSQDLLGGGGAHWRTPLACSCTVPSRRLWVALPTRPSYMGR